ncbi:hypothetical protein Pla175_37040 [Pirellulimonas nuda]|uniref:Uncharacterized protein n=1 Tax=Pirellulimonas nuda TaxID=2528009 RepID=A0A518DFP8_9BACT|nr:hypothetical protein [Pirellulimonas nuda]QDU90301.1 hypothetical protein Pla175_37040 [Pirellulimonas nuda]
MPPTPQLDHGAPSFWSWRLGATVAGGGICGVVLSIVTTLLAELGVAPLGLTSLALGAVIGLAAAGTAWLYLYGSRAGLVFAAAGVGGFSAAMQHAWAYFVYVQRWRLNRIENPQVALFRPDDRPLDFSDYLWSDATPANLIWWTEDVLLAALAAGCVAWLIRRNWAYCADCLGWYTLRWRGPMGAPDAPEAARGLEDAPADARVTVQSCTQQCGPWRVELRWDENGKQRVQRRWVKQD